jgi:polar amino acid transport system permease protein
MGLSRPPAGDSTDLDPLADEPVGRRIYWGRWISGGIATVVVGLAIVGLAHNSGMGWDKVWEFLFSGAIMSGLLVTIEIAVVSMLFSIVGGVILALMTQSRNPVLYWFSMTYIWLFRGVPLLVQIIFWFNLAIIIPKITIWLPFVGVVAHWDTNTLINGFAAALLGLSLNESAYMAEIIRGAITGVSRGQMEAGLALGLKRSRALRKVVLPQTVGIVIPPTGSQFLGLIKNSSLVSVVGGGELLTKAQYIYSENFAVVPLLVVVSIWYLVLTSVATVLQHMVERRLAASPGVLSIHRLGRRILGNLWPRPGIR